VGPVDDDGGKIQALVDRGLLQPKVELEWKAAAGEEFPTEDVKEQVVFTSFFERGFNLPVGDFFPWLVVLLQARVGTSCPQLHYCSQWRTQQVLGAWSI
jgi:hypothetical protein